MDTDNKKKKNELYHHGVKGMKWGVRHDKTNSNYTSNQRKRDKQIYGSSAVKRINRQMNRGSSISGARSNEAARINSARRRARVSGQVGSVVGSVGGTIGGYLGSDYLVKRLNINDPQTSIVIKGIVSAGALKVGNQLGRYGGQSIAMLAGGYDPKKFR